MTEMRVKVAEDGRIVIPAEYRQALGLHVGDDVILRLEDGEVRILTLQKAIQRAQELVRRYIPEGRSLADELIAERRMEQYNKLEVFADVPEGLQRLQQKGHTMVVFSNGTPTMLRTLMESAKLNNYLSGFISVDEVRTYKPSPRTYNIKGVR